MAGDNATFAASSEGKSPAARYWPNPTGSVRDVCAALDEWFNAGLGEPRDIREPRS